MSAREPGGGGLCFFPTAIGICGIAWTGDGVAGLQLPEDSEPGTRARLFRRFPQVPECDPPPGVRPAVDAVVGLLAGREVDLASVPLDLAAVPEFHRRVYEALRSTRRGDTLTYGELAARAGSPGAARAVGTALRRNPLAVLVPCHRVVAAGGLGGFSAAGGLATKARMLAIEGTRIPPGSLARSSNGFDYDAATALRHLAAADPELGGLIARIGPFTMSLGTTPSIFVALAEAITYQQLSGRAAETIYRRLCDLFATPEAGPTAAELLRLTDEQLRGAGVSRPKIRALRDLAGHQLRGEIPTLGEARRLGDEELVERLTVVRGVGRWTVEMLLIFRLGRPDVLPVHDLGIRRGFARTFGGTPAGPEEIAERGRLWRPYRSVASWYLWRAAETAAPGG